MDIKPDKDELDAIEAPAAPADATLLAVDHTNALASAAARTPRQRPAPDTEVATPRRRARKEAPIRSATRASARQDTATSRMTAGSSRVAEQAAESSSSSSGLSDIEEPATEHESTQAVYDCGSGQAPPVQGEYCTVFDAKYREGYIIAFTAKPTAKTRKMLPLYRYSVEDRSFTRLTPSLRPKSGGQHQLIPWADLAEIAHCASKKATERGRLWVLIGDDGGSLIHIDLHRSTWEKLTTKKRANVPASVKMPSLNQPGLITHNDASLFIFGGCGADTESDEHGYRTVYGYDGDQALVRLAGHTGDLKICLGQACKVVKRPGGSGKLLVLPGIAGKGQLVSPGPFSILQYDPMTSRFTPIQNDISKPPQPHETKRFAFANDKEVVLVYFTPLPKDIDTDAMTNISRIKPNKGLDLCVTFYNVENQQWKRNKQFTKLINDAKEAFDFCLYEPQNQREGIRETFYFFGTKKSAQVDRVYEIVGRP